MTDTMDPQDGFGAMPVRSPLWRYRPWLTDGVFVAHESLMLFGQMAKLMPGPGWWAFGPAGATLDTTRGPGPNLSEWMAGRVAEATPCVLNHEPYARHADREGAAADAFSQAAEVLDHDGHRWLFNLAYLIPARYGQREWTWQLAPITDRPTGRVLIGLDHKDRPRFALMSLDPTPETIAPDLAASALDPDAVVTASIEIQNRLTSWLSATLAGDPAATEAAAALLNFDDPVRSTALAYGVLVVVSALMRRPGEELPAGQHWQIEVEPAADTDPDAEVSPSMSLLAAALGAASNDDIDGFTAMVGAVSPQERLDLIGSGVEAFTAAARQRRGEA